MPEMEDGIMPPGGGSAALREVVPKKVKHVVCPVCGDKTLEGMYEKCRDCGVELVPEKKGR
uniref:Uncharacterized protein n=1 Tax=viral metagenome TaxID=1070528 RepID=A0A6M3J7Y1_9ZZZZ